MSLKTLAGIRGLPPDCSVTVVQPVLRRKLLLFPDGVPNKTVSFLRIRTDSLSLCFPLVPGTLLCPHCLPDR